MSTREERHEKFASAVTGSTRNFPWPWSKTAAYVLELRKKAQLAPAAVDTITGSPSGERQKDEIIKNLVQVHQDQQASVAAAENEARTMRSELDTARKQMNQIYSQLQQTHGQLQQMQAQAQQAIQQAKAQTDAVQQSMGPEIQKAQQNASNAADEATRARIELSRLQQIHEQVRQSVLQYKASVMNAVSQDPVTLAEAQRLQQDQQQQMQAQMLQQQQAQAQGVIDAQSQMSQAQRGVPGQIAAQQPGMVAQAAYGMGKTAGKNAENPISELSRAVAGGGNRSGFRRAIASQYLSQAIGQGAKSPEGGLRIPFDSMAGQILQKRASLDKQAISTDNVHLLSLLGGGGVGAAAGGLAGHYGTKDPKMRARNAAIGALAGGALGAGGGELAYRGLLSEAEGASQRTLPAMRPALRDATAGVHAGSMSRAAAEEMIKQRIRSAIGFPTTSVLTGAGLGGLAGATAGYAGTADKKKRVRNALLGLGIGAGAGGAGLGLAGHSLTSPDFRFNWA